MENIKYNLFDLFSYTIPGALLCISILLIIPPATFFDAPYEKIKEVSEKINLYHAVIFILLSYVLGFIVSALNIFVIPFINLYIYTYKRMFLYISTLIVKRDWNNTFFLIEEINKWAKQNINNSAINKKSTLGNSAKFTLVRELSKENLKYIEQWNALAKMANSLGIVIIIVTLLFKFKYGSIDSLYLFSMFLISFRLLVQAKKYRKWAEIDLDNSIYYLKLQEKISKDCTIEKM